MEKNILIVNAGSASLKLALYASGREFLRAHYEYENAGFVVNIIYEGDLIKEKISSLEYKEALVHFLRILKSKNAIKSSGDIAVVGMRIVAPGVYFLADKVIDETYIRELKRAEGIAPLHLSPILRELDYVREFLPSAQIIGISDSSFYADLPDYASSYGLPDKLSKDMGIRRYGYHGISASSIVRKLSILDDLPSRIIICHLGSGASVVAIRDGHPVEVSMGFTPLEGLVMGTRVGDIDSGAVLYMEKSMGLTSDEMRIFLNSKCGLLGISGQTADIRELLALESAGVRGASLALNVFVHRIKKYIGAYTATMNGLDLLVFTATIGERSFIIRERVCENLDFLGINLDKDRNNKIVSLDAYISAQAALTKVAVITSDEIGEIYRIASSMS